MYYDLNEEELKSLCRSNIETLETWIRQLVDAKMSEAYGPDYLNAKQGDSYLLSDTVRTRVHKLMKDEPGKYVKAVDAFSFDDLCHILCHPKFYRPLFKETLDYVYPQGKSETKEFLHRISSIKDCLLHDNTISIHQAEQAVCYTDDFIEGLKKCYRDKGLERTWDVPKIIKVQDSVGNVFENLNEVRGGGACICTIDQPFYCGEKYEVYIEMDSSYSPDEYDIRWWIDPARHIQEGGSQYMVTFEEKDIGEKCLICCSVISKKDWHRYGSYDFNLILSVCVLPPAQD